MTRRVGADRKPLLFSTAVNHPNGLALSDSLWVIPLDEEGNAAGAAKRVARLGPQAANDGLAMDREGRGGKIWRVPVGVEGQPVTRWPQSSPPRPARR